MGKVEYILVISWLDDWYRNLEKLSPYNSEMSSNYNDIIQEFEDEKEEIDVIHDVLRAMGS